ncbi:MAG: hypothetical protein V4726_16700 [Verrucomicrobiota bacterium]
MKPPSRFPLRLCLCLVLAACLLVKIRASAQIDFAPPNDLFNGRTDIGSGETAEARQKVMRASTEFGDPVQDSVWWQWTAPRDGWWEIDPITPKDDWAYDPYFQVFQGDRLDTLLTAPTGGLALRLPSPKRVLFQAAAGLRYQIAASCVQPPYPDIHFALRPVTPAANTTLAASQPLTPVEPAGSEPGSNWSGRGWSVRVTDPPFVTSQGIVLYAPLFWKWACPLDGDYSTENGPDSTRRDPPVAVFRGQDTSPTGEILTDGFLQGAKAGDTFTFVTGAPDYAADALRYYDLRLIRHSTVEIPPSNQNNPYLLQGSLPRVITPPTNAPRSPGLWWTWNCQDTGWVEFDGGSLVPFFHSHVTFPIFDPIIIAQGGKHYLWVVPGSYTLLVQGWQWPAGGSFKLSLTAPPAPANDAFAKGTSLGTDSTTSISGTLAGATRELGDPPAPGATSPFPTVWHRWQPAGGTGIAELFISYPRYGSQSVARLQVFTGTDPAYLNEIPVTHTEPDGFGTQRFQFPADRAFTTYHLCLSGRGAEYDLQAKLFTRGTTGTGHPSNFMTELAGGAVSEGGAVPDPFNPAWFVWKATADGSMTWAATAATIQLRRGPAYAGSELLYDKTDHPLTLAVSAGETYWFRCSQEDQTGGRPLIHRLRVLFSQKTVPVPGDEATRPIPLGSQLPVETVCPLFATTASWYEWGLSRPALRERLNHALWYSWTAPADASGCGITVSGITCEVFADKPEGPRVAAADPGNTDGDAFFAPQPGRTYFIMVQSTPDMFVNDRMKLTMRGFLTPRAPNDDFANAARLDNTQDTSLNYTDVSRGGDSDHRYRFTAEPDEPPADPSQPTATRSAWWRWTAPRSGVFRVRCPIPLVSSNEAVTNAYTRTFTVAVYHDATSLAGLTRVPGIPSNSHPDSSFYWTPPPMRSLTFQAENGRSYLFQVASPDEFGGLSFGITPGDAYDVWSMAQSRLDPLQAGPDSNPSGDGMNNLLKFCLGLDPSLPVLADPAASRAPAGVLSPDGTALHYTFWSDRFNTGSFIPFPASGSPAFANTARLIAERSSDLENWIRVTDAESLGDNRWRVKLPINGTHSKRFVRLRAEWILPSQPQ